jgi:Secretion system C-terminal sorting domain
LWRATVDRMLMYFFPDNSSDVIAENLNPSDFILYQNYPNPFNPSTIISWQSAVSSWQTLKIFDLLGNEVATLIDEYQPAGTYEVEFNVAQVSRPEISSGVYFYQLKIGSPETSSGQGTVQTKKMILLK